MIDLSENKQNIKSSEDYRFTLLPEDSLNNLSKVFHRILIY